MNTEKALILQKVSVLYTREKMFKFNEERGKIMDARERFLNCNDEEDDCELLSKLVASKL